MGKADKLKEMIHQSLQRDFEHLNYENKCRECLKTLLLEHRYPDESFYRPLYYDSLYYDLVVQNPHTNEPLFCFEIKSKEALEKCGYQYYQTHKPQGENILFYFAYIDENGNLKLIHMYSDLSESKFLTYLENGYSSVLPFYEDAIKQQVLYQKEKKQKKIKQKKDIFSIWCYTVTVVLVILFALELFNIFRWTTERVIILGFIILIPLLPLFAEIKIGDYTFKRKKQD